jgi:hypothetical protein
MTVAQVEAFFERYAQAFTRLDVDGISDLWAYPAYIAARGNRFSFSEEEFRRNLNNVCAFYKAQGMTSASARVVCLSQLTESVASARTAYQLVDDRGATIAEWVHAYLLSETRDGLRLIASMPDEEMAAWDARGATMGQA